jgi:hypothetical protein
MLEELRKLEEKGRLEDIMMLTNKEIGGDYKAAGNKEVEEIMR